MRELDVLLNRFIDSRYSDLSTAEMDDFDTLLEQSDIDLYGWLTGRGAPEQRDLAVLVGRIRRLNN